MVEKTTLQNLEYMQVCGKDSVIHYGCDQEWYPAFWQRMAGCGPSTASNIFLYLQRAGKIKLPVEVQTREDFIRLMELVWKHVTPTRKGVYMVSLLTDGMQHFARSAGFTLEYRSLEIPKNKNARPDINMLSDFIAQGIKEGSPLAFLNLSNGEIKHLDKWHWVTLVGIEPEDDKAIITVYDAAKVLKIDLNLWLQTTTLGGGFAYFKVREK